MIDFMKLRTLMDSRGWSEVQLARKLKLDYSFVYRVLRGERNAGKKFYEGFLALCKKEDLNIHDYILQSDQDIDEPNEKKVN